MSHHPHAHPHHDHAHPHAADAGRNLTRRSILAGGAAAAAIAALPSRALARPLDQDVRTSRVSRLEKGIWAAHSDLHNHSQLSDAVGDPGAAHRSMRAAGLDIAALTDHTVAAAHNPAFNVCRFVPAPPFGDENACTSALGMSEHGFEVTGQHADAVDAPGSFTALRGFEWSSPYLGHINVWFTSQVTDPLATGGLTAAGLARNGVSMDALRALLRPLLPLPGAEQLLTAIQDAGPDGMAGFYTWLSTSPEAQLAGGSDGIAGFNHPNREPETFDAFAFDPRVRQRMVSMEILNRREDYLFKNHSRGMHSPLTACLDAGWHVGLTGVTDEHGEDWGEPEGKGRTGLFLKNLDRDAVKSAMLTRRMFATRERGLRLDVGANGSTRMGGFVPGRSPWLNLDIDLDWGTERAGMPVEIQILTSGGGSDVPEVSHVESVRLPDPRDRKPLTVRAPIDRTKTSWAVVRIADPAQLNDSPGPAGHPCNNRALAYASPFYLADARPQRSAGPRRAAPALPISLGGGH
ncbi:hypothetical protein [Kribbia dieselivorans]|uniref:hypothetical protein n=1 Tax=Kribbia dieselivorans TaxID=331526 RepID=UPI000838995A|nr:hypothetical protein [Kribbia dieselivorans]